MLDIDYYPNKEEAWLEKEANDAKQKIVDELWVGSAIGDEPSIKALQEAANDLDATLLRIDNYHNGSTRRKLHEDAQKLRCGAERIKI